MDEGSPVCLQDDRCKGIVPPMTVDDFFAEAKRLNMRMLGTPEETRAALDIKDAEIARLRAGMGALIRERRGAESIREGLQALLRAGPNVGVEPVTPDTEE